LRFVVRKKKNEIAVYREASRLGCFPFFYSKGELFKELRNCFFNSFFYALYMGNNAYESPY
jgi:hypothetical protein